MNYSFVLSQRAPIAKDWFFEAHIFPAGSLASASRDDLIEFLNEKASDIIHEHFLPSTPPNQFLAFNPLFHIEAHEVSMAYKNPTSEGDGFQLFLLAPS